MNYEATLAVSPGNGRLARRSQALLFVPDPTDAADFINVFLRADDADLEEKLAGFVLSRNAEAPEFAFVAWPVGPRGSRLHVIVRGETTVTSDIDSMPRLSGAGSSTWTEHRVLKNPGAAEIQGGADAVAGTDLTSGVVVAGGFALTLDADPAPRPVGQPVATTARAEQQEPHGSPGPAVEALPSKVEAPEPPDDLSIPTTADGLGLDALAAASGADWMEDSLQLGSATEAAAPAEAADPTTGGAQPELGPPPEAPTPPAKPPRPPGPPQFPSDDLDAEATLAPLNSTQQAVAGDQAVVGSRGNHERRTRARLCPTGHPNSPHASECRLCGSPIPAGDAVVTVEQPTLARLRFPDGTAVGLVGDLVIGRNPTDTSARVEDAQLVSIAAPSSVSRTHLHIAVDGWRILATDCGSRAGSALVVGGDDEPIALEPWMPHEVNGGDRLYLGGPTCLTIEEVGL